jgi:hypothetical protein
MKYVNLSNIKISLKRKVRRGKVRGQYRRCTLGNEKIFSFIKCKFVSLHLVGDILVRG